MPAYKLISFKLCPFVQRSAITLLEKGVPYTIEYIELEHKPAWFVELSPLGKVPVLQVDSTVLFESAVINEYLDEVGGGERLLPADPLARARDRAWIEFASAAIIDHWRYTAANEEAEALTHLEAVRAKLRRLEQELAGPLWHGESLSLVDTAFAPLLQRVHWTDVIAPEHVAAVGLPKVQTWTQSLLARPSVQGSTVPEIETLYREYLKKPRGNPPQRSWLGRQAA